MQEGCRGRFTSCLRMTLETGWERLPAERLRTQDAAGRVAYRDIAAGHDFPPYNRSAVDGYAIRTHGRGGTSGSEELEVGGLSLSAAQVHQVVSAECIEVSTGTPLPEGFDLVVKKEDATLSGRKVLPGRHMPWENVAVRGERT
ncbi:hypothetical protein [Thermogymnomonas acidicola]|uniref:hypothetical protein n=1 Tax=Thermogymnomonas acidicola TaxID=399579 RepID=UPI0009467A46|nr:hypothetical protein [Thermogymnomonas acidicola]